MLDLGLERGIGFGAHFFEVYAEDMDDPLSAAVLTRAGAILTTPPIVPRQRPLLPPRSTPVPRP